MRLEDVYGNKTKKRKLKKVGLCFSPCDGEFERVVVLRREDFALRWPFGCLVCEEGRVVVVGEHAVFDLEGVRQSLHQVLWWGCTCILEGMGRDAHSKLSRGPDEPAAGEDIMREPAVPLAGFQGDCVICGVKKSR